MSKKLITFFLCTIVLFVIIIFGTHTTVAQTNSSKYDSDGFLIRQPSAPAGGGSLDVISADQAPVDSKTLISESDVKQGKIADCFDYYTFGSIAINLSTDQASYQNGDPVIIRGTIGNKNKYPVVGLDIKARVVKNIPNPNPLRSEIIILNEFDVAKDVGITAGGEIKVSSTYQLPKNSPSGNYQILFYAVEQNRFNLAGLSFTNDIFSSKVDFKVNGKQPEHVYLDQTQIFVGGQPHDVMAFMTEHDGDVEIPITIPLNNPTSVAEKMKVTYDLYSWDSSNPENLISTQSDGLTVPANSSIKLTYKINKGVLPVYYLKITAVPADSLNDESVFSEKTISNIRLVVNGKSKPRFNFVGVDSYPFKKGVENTLVTCFHNTSGEINKEITKIETTVYDQKKNELSKSIYQGKTIPEITGLINKFTPNKDVSEFTVVSEMSDAQGVVIDRVEKTYSCKTIDPKSCPKEDEKPLKTAGAIALVLGLVVITVSAIVYKKNIVNKIKA
ncbi:MAG: hypothetical protein WCO09_00405 [bacterium]